MSGIAGIISGESGEIPSSIGRMLRCMTHRGTDDEGYDQLAIGGDREDRGLSLGLGCRRLATMDTSDGDRQPLRHPATGDRLIFDGFISGHRALRYRLESMGCRFHTSGDGEVLLHALVTWGEQALDVIDGMFAFAFYEAKSQRLLLARDHLGIKPLYIARTGRAVVFASEVRAVLASGLVADDLDPAGIASFLAFGAPQDPLTVHREVRSMPAGTFEWISSETDLLRSGSCRRYWRFPTVEAQADVSHLADYVHFELSKQIRDHGVTCRPSCVFLSGGIDSAAVASFAKSLTGPVQTFFIGYQAAHVRDGAAAAAKVAEAIGSRHFQTILDDDWALQLWDQWLKVADRPSIGGFNTYVISSAVNDAGIVVALSGLGGDEIFGGYDSFRSIPRALRLVTGISRLPRPARQLAAMTAQPFLPAAMRARLVEGVRSGCSPLELAVKMRRVTGDVTLRKLGLDASRLGLTLQYLPAEAYELIQQPRDDVFRQISAVECVLHLGNALSRDADVNGMANSLEIRVPFASRSIVDLVAPLREHVKSPLGKPPKHLLRDAIAGRIPDMVMRRSAVKTALPYQQWMYGPLRESCEAAVQELAACPLLPSSVVHDLWRICSPDHGLSDGAIPMSLVTLGSYLGQMKSRRVASR